MDTLSDEEEPVATRWIRKHLKSGKLKTADTQVVHTVEWPHEFVYIVEGKPAEYETLSVPLFVSGYIKIMDGQKPEIKTRMSAHLADLMADSELYGSEAVCIFHAIWHQQLEQGIASWGDVELKISFCSCGNS